MKVDINRTWLFKFVLLFFISIILVVIFGKFEYRDSLKKPSINEKLKYMENYLHKNPDDSKAMIEISNLNIDAGNYSEAQKLLVKMLIQHPNDSYAWYRLGCAYIETNNLSAAQESLNKVIEIDSNKSYGYFYFSNLMTVTDIDKAISLAEKSLELAISEKATNIKYLENYVTLLKSNKESRNSNNIYEACLSLVKSEYICSTTLKVDLINNALNQNFDKDEAKKDELINLKSKLVG